MADLLEMRNISKQFPGVLANNNINFEVKKGEVHALLGENGAGKSTLMNILSGLYEPSSGQILINGKQVQINSPRDAINKGIGMVYQHFMLIPPLSVVENIILGMRQPHEPILDVKGAAKKIKILSDQYRMNIDPYAKIWQLSVGQQQRVEIVKALYRGANLLILDEPTAVLTPQEIEELFNMIKRFIAEEHAVIFISHKMNEVKTISDRITVLRKGEKVGTVPKSVTKDKLARMMVGRSVNFKIEKREFKPGKPVLKLQKVEALNNKGLQALKDISFSVCEGEILGIAGVDGNGQSELVEVITGLRKSTGGEIKLLNNNITNIHPRNILKHKIAHIPEDRHLRGLILEMNLKENLILHDYFFEPHSKGLFLNWDYIEKHATSLINEYDIRTPSEEIMAKNLSGGNQQKLILARELHNEPRLLIAMHPTRGLDVGAIEYVHERILEQRDNGTAVLYISTEIEEILDISDRVAVICNGQIMGIVIPRQVSIKEIGLMMAGSRWEDIK